MAGAMRAAVLFLAAVALMATGTASAETIDKTVTLEAAGTMSAFHEENLQGQPGTNLTYEWARATSGDVRFDVHSHDADNNVVYHVQPNAGPTGSGTVTVPETGVISFFWENKGGEPVDISYTITGGEAVDEEDDGNGIPAPAAVAALAVLGVAALAASRR